MNKDTITKAIMDILNSDMKFEDKTQTLYKIFYKILLKQKAKEYAKLMISLTELDYGWRHFGRIISEKEILKILKSIHK